jgi:hypothetical protein
MRHPFTHPEVAKYGDLYTPEINRHMNAAHRRRVWSNLKETAGLVILWLCFIAALILL